MPNSRDIIQKQYVAYYSVVGGKGVCVLEHVIRSCALTALTLVVQIKQQFYICYAVQQNLSVW